MWEARNQGLPGMDVSAGLVRDTQTSGVLYAGTNGGGVFRTADGGDGWTDVSAGLGSLSVAVLALDHGSPQRVYVGTGDNGILRGTGQPDQWEPRSVGLAGDARRGPSSSIRSIRRSCTPPPRPVGSGRPSTAARPGGEAGGQLAGSQVDALGLDPGDELEQPSFVYAATAKDGIYRSGRRRPDLGFRLATAMRRRTTQRSPGS